MALSVKKFIHALNCPEPENMVNVTYHVDTPDLLCGGGGTPTAIFSDDGTTLGGIVENDGTGNAATSGVCAEGMDVVFVVDYTGSMSGAINGVKSGLADLANTIDTLSSGNYRLGLVLFDGRSSNTTPYYNSSGVYQALPLEQRYIAPPISGSGQTVSNSNTRNMITCMEKMNTVGNIGDVNSGFTKQLNTLAAGTGGNGNSSTGMSLGDSLECGGLAIKMVAGDDFAGSWRSGVQRLIILITDTHPETNTTYFQNTIFPVVDNNGVQVMVNSSQPSDARYSYLSQNTNPPGSDHYSLSFNSTWTTGLETSLTTLCEETFTYTCESLAVGWYLEDGQHVAWYWDGSSWTNQHYCEYTVTINLVDDVSNGGIDSIPSSHPYYSDGNTYTITGTPGTAFTLQNTVTTLPDYTFDDIDDITITRVGGGANIASLQSYTDDGNGNTNLLNTLTEIQFQLQGSVPTEDVTYDVTVSATNDSTIYSFSINVIGDETDGSGYGQGDTLDANSQIQSPAGYVRVNPTTPSSGWIDVGSTYYRSARRITFTGIAGSSHTWDVDLTPDPTDYDLTLNSVTQTASSTAVGNSFGSTYTLSNANKDIKGTFNMPSGGGSVELFVYGQVNQPDYTFELTASESITGASIDGAPWSQQYTGYTGDTFDFTIQLSENTDYDSFEITGVTKSGNDTGAVTYSIDNTNGRVTGTVTMPQGGGDCALAIAGTAEQSEHTYTITFVDPYTDSAKWQQITYTGLTGSFHATTHPLSFQDGDTTYYVGTSGVQDGVTNDDTSNLVSNRNHATDNTVTDLNIVLASMPQGGGSATVTVTGQQVSNTYTLNVTWSMASSNTTPACAFTNNNNSSTYSQQFTGTVGTQYTAEAQIETPLNYIWRGSNPVAVTGVLGGSATEPNTYTSNLSGTVAIPSGGGNLTITVTPDIRLALYTYTATVQTNGSTSSVNQYSEALASNASSVSGVNNSNGTVTITYGGSAGTTWNNINVAVVANNAVDYNPEITSISKPTWFTVTENEYGGEGMDIDFQMPSLDPRSGNLSTGTITASVSLSEVQHTFTLTSTDNISNVSTSQTTQYFTGGISDEIDWSTTYTATSGYTFNITGVSVSGTNSDAVLVVDSTGTDIGGVISMPSGGGSATVTANGTSTQTTYNYTITWTNNIGGADWTVNNADSYIQSVTGLVPGGHTFIQQELDPDSGREITSMSVSSNNSNVIIEDYDTGGLIMVRVNMPANATGNQSAVITATGSTSVIQRVLDVFYLESIDGAFVAGSPAGSGITSSTYVGTPGQTVGPVYRYLRSDSGYTNPTITSISDGGSPYVDPSISSNSGAGYHEFTYNYQIPSTNTSATITINGSVDGDCESCSFSANGVAPSTYDGSDGEIRVIYTDGACGDPVSWSIEPSEGTYTNGIFGPIWTGLTPGTYSIAVTGVPCTSSVLVVVPNATTTTQAPGNFTYYNAQGCDTGNFYVLRGDTSYFIGSIVDTTKGGNDSNMCISGLAKWGEDLWEYQINSVAEPDEICAACDGGDPEGPTP